MHAGFTMANKLKIWECLSQEERQVCLSLSVYSCVCTHTQRGLAAKCSYMCLKQYLDQKLIHQLPWQNFCLNQI